MILGGKVRKKGRLLSHHIVHAAVKGPRSVRAHPIMEIQVTLWSGQLRYSAPDDHRHRSFNKLSTLLLPVSIALLVLFLDN